MLGDQHAGWHNIASSNALALDFFVEYEHVLAILPAFGSWLGMSHARPAAAEHETYRARCKRHDGHDDHEDHSRVLDRARHRARLRVCYAQARLGLGSRRVRAPCSRRSSLYARAEMSSDEVNASWSILGRT